MVPLLGTFSDTEFEGTMIHEQVNYWVLPTPKLEINAYE